MGIASTMFLPLHNDVERGGGAIKVSLVRVGRMVKAARDTFKRVYKLDGTYHYPKIRANRLRKKGDEYFKNMEVTGSKEGTEKKPKFSLRSYFADTELPRLDVIAAQIESETGKRVVVRYQMDGAGPHKDGTLLDYLDEELSARGWHLKFQPSQSPLTNIKDACIFPALSKAVSNEQGLSHASSKEKSCGQQWRRYGVENQPPPPTLSAKASRRTS
jgi:hypothetical protein